MISYIHTHIDKKVHAHLYRRGPIWCRYYKQTFFLSIFSKAFFPVQFCLPHRYSSAWPMPGSLYIYTHTFTHIHICICIYVYIYMFIYIDTYIQLTGFTCITPTQFYYTGTAARGRCRGVTGPEVIKKSWLCKHRGSARRKSLPPSKHSATKKSCAANM